MGEEEDTSSQMSGTVEESARNSICIDSLLCYASTARHSLKSDEIVRICVAFYKESDIIRSKDRLCELIGEKPKRRRNENRLINEMKDIVELLTRCDDNSISLPQFVTDAFDGLPPTSGFEVVANYIMQLNDELVNLRKEVNSLKESNNQKCCNPDVEFMKEDLLEIKGEVRKLNHKLLNDNIRRDSLILECFDNSSRNTTVKDKREIISEVGDSFLKNKDHSNGNSVKEKNKGLMNDVSSVVCQPLSIGDELCSSEHPSTSQESLYWQREVQDFGGAPSAPTFADVAVAGMEEVTKNANGSVTFTSRNIREGKQRNLTVNENQRKGQSSDSDISVDVKVIEKKTGAYVDDEGYQLVKRKRRPVNIVGSKRTKENDTIKGAVRVADLYLGNCELEVSSESISDYIFKEMNIVVNKCEPLASRNVNSKSFKVTLNLADRQKLLSPDVWPEGIICRKFYSSRKQ